MGASFRRTLALALAAFGAVPVLVLTVAATLLTRPDAAPREVAAWVVLTLGASLALSSALLAAGVAGVLVAPIQRLRDGLTLMAGPSPTHRLDTPDEAELAELARAANDLAERAAQSNEEAEQRVTSATRSLQIERSTLAAVVFALAEGVVVCNEDLRIILSNGAARRMLSAPARPVRRGESIFEYLPELLLRPMLDALVAHAAGAGTEGRIQRGTISLHDGSVAQIQGLRTGAEAPGQYVFVLRDVTEHVVAARTRDRALADTVQRLRGPVAGVLSAAEILRDYEMLSPEQRASFLRIVAHDAELVASELAALQAAAAPTTATWAGEATDLAALVRQALAVAEPTLRQAGLGATASGEEISIWADRLALHLAARHLIAVAAAHAPPGSTLRARWRPIETDLAEIAIETAATGVDEQALDTPTAGDGRTVRTIVEDHGGQAWVHAIPGGTVLTLAVPVGGSRPRRATRRHDDAVERQIEALVGHGGFFDPSPPAISPARPGGRLRDLTYAVFDLETTGLSPGHGDRVVSIGAVRVRAGRVVPEDYFFTLVDPERPIPASSTRIHGITDDMVANQPSVEAALDAFAAYVGDSVPVAHVASFDLAFLNPQLGRMGRPSLGGGVVLDTFLLTYSLFPSWTGYNLEDVAERLGLEVVGRHTALGDARTAAEILARLVDLLEQRGITTLERALELQGGNLARRAIGTLGVARDRGL